MASLSETAYYTRRGVKYAAIALVIYLIFRLAWTVIKPLFYQPPPPPPPGKELGQLPSLEFPSQPHLPQLEFKLETPSGAGVPPQLPQRARVYSLKVNRPRYADLEAAQAIAQKLGFKNQPQALSPSVYRWQHSQVLSGDLTINIIHRSFDLVLDWRTDQHLLEERRPIDQDKITQDLIRFFQRAQLFTKDLENGYQKRIYYRYLDGQLIRTQSLSQADLVQINFFRQAISASPISLINLDAGVNLDAQPPRFSGKSPPPPQKDQFPVLPLDPDRPLVWGLVTAAKDSRKRIVEVHYRHQQITDKSGEYPLIGATAAWEQLTQGKGYIVDLGTNQDQVTVRDISLAYFEPQEPSAFLFPIYVFRGDNDFLAYLPAVKYE